MKNIVLAIITSVVFTCCGSEDFDVDYLLNDGYVEANCDNVRRKEKKEYSLIEFFEKVELEESRDLILARCYKYDKCNFTSLSSESDFNILCQQYIVRKEDTKKDIYIQSFKMLDDHRVLYLLN